MPRGFIAIFAACLMLIASIGWACDCVSGAAYAATGGHDGHSGHAQPAHAAAHKSHTAAHKSHAGAWHAAAYVHAGHAPHTAQGSGPHDQHPDPACGHDCLSCTPAASAATSLQPVFFSASLALPSPLAANADPATGRRGEPARWSRAADPPPGPTPLSLHVSLLI
jgi:hypothetical protein